MKAIISIVTIISLLSFSTYACGISHFGKKVSYKDLRKFYSKNSRKISSADLVEFANGHPAPSWEAKLGNLLLANLPNNQKKVVLSLPVLLPKGDRPPFGDGQLNAKMDFGQWDRDDFPVVGIETTQNGQVKREYRFHSSLNIKKYDEILLEHGWIEVKAEASSGKSSYYFNFQTGVLPVSEFLKGIPSELRTFPNNRTAPNVAKISKADAFKSLNESDLGHGFNSRNPWPADNVHGKFPNNDKYAKITALGGVHTWGTATESHQRPANGPFKYLYTCFDPRNINDEKREGVPSGSGWHYVGDPAETLFNTLSTSDIPFAVGRTHGKPNPAHGFNQTITAVWMKPDEVQVTRREEFHWYVIPYEQPVCTEIWVHPCEPNLFNNWGFKNDCEFK